ncbi:hypothetical protein CLV28_1340 [Sediminihabitans luteus]|uniref:Schlafen group 3-like DNA/RNA helicase domain-containing protein n=1 Tax=Sediminihabitans luteus TaxID=1138585 RepID=A0A2M9CPR9_9CELL|nr:DUF2075 domain-containing protein [Sediminihabitans luteus]PJJ73858.1 hypothetical protein CLV28_1340 [Sediminihabitans luteus]GII98231.1 hypothetical protein Slu03_06090 [Sediminihabitans luteus]
MTSFEIVKHGFSSGTSAELKALDRRYLNWPVVYVLDNGREVYVGETGNAVKRMEQHSRTKAGLKQLKIVLDDRFNKSVCLDLESHLIRYFAGDESFQVLNRNDGVVDAEYFDREEYRQTFQHVFDELRELGLFERSIPEIENSDLFKYSPFKALSQEQMIVVTDILEGLFEDLDSDTDDTMVIQGSPGTGKTIIAVFMLKLLQDIASADLQEVFDADTMFSEFFTDEHQALLESRRFGLVVPQQSLRKTLQGVFRKTPGLSPEMVLSPFDVGGAAERFDLLIVDEAHRLNQRANQPSAMQNLRFAEINERLFGRDDARYTQLDWIRTQSRRQIFLLDRLQSIKPADLSQEIQRRLVDEASRAGRQYALTSQMRVRAGSDYVGYVRSALSNEPPAIPESFEPYDLRFFDDIGAMAAEIQARNDEHGLARLVAGYAWPWVTKKNPTAYDIEIGGHGFRWNTVATDWINSARSAEEVGSIHTVQGYDLNFAGVIIGPDLQYDQAERRIVFDRANYHDKKGKENNPQLGIKYSDEDLLAFVANIYSVLLTRGIRGTYVYVCDLGLRERLRPYFAPNGPLISPPEATGSAVLF